MAVRSSRSSGPSNGSAETEPNDGPYLAQGVSPMDEAPVLDRDTHPDVRMPLQLSAELREPLVTLGEDLEGVLWGAPHHQRHPR